MDFPFYSHDEYLSRRIQGERISSVPCMLGANAAHYSGDAFYVLRIEKDTWDYYQFSVKDQRFTVSGFKESLAHDIKISVGEELAEDESTTKWWNEVFFSKDGKVSYDPYYDSLRVSEHSEVTFRQLIDKVKGEMSAWDLGFHSGMVFLTGAYSVCPLVRYSCQEYLKEAFGCETEPLASSVEVSNENDYVRLDDARLDNVLINVCNGLPLRFFLNNSVRVEFPVDDVALQSEIFGKTSWREMLPHGDSMNDYSVNGFGFKYLYLTVDCDSFSNIFLSCTDVYGNKMVKQI